MGYSEELSELAVVENSSPKLQCHDQIIWGRVLLANWPLGNTEAHDQLIWGNSFTKQVSYFEELSEVAVVDNSSPKLEDHGQTIWGRVLLSRLVTLKK